ncbi:MAG: ABC transporter ATP-binding protein [Firmicutes bacterium]|uniref:ABC transporter ATP-binding protein n=1 Tax=Candidatus Scybalomonas excrementavium TaxID=2840943 RepID=A0A9D9N7M0_9FIRM|nr:ABC transporter ATP-binding protein [Candidatus Scybalomonas excrementavium]
MTKNARLLADNLTTGYEKRTIISNINVKIPENQISVILGANGCGKSTLLKTFARLIQPYDGQILLDGKLISSIPSKQVAQIMGFLPQSPIVPEGIKVTDLVTRGRFPYRKPLKGMTVEDFKAVEEAMDIMGVTELADRSVDELSGGQRQRVWIALALAQQTDILFLDEPTTYLDIAYQVEILDLLTDLNRKRKTTIVMVLHDINLSARYANYIFAMKDGKLVKEGSPSEIITSELMKQVYGLDCMVMEDPISKTPFIVPKGRHHSK